MKTISFFRGVTILVPFPDSGVKSSGFVFPESLERVVVRSGSADPSIHLVSIAQLASLKKKMIETKFLPLSHTWHLLQCFAPTDGAARIFPC